MRTSPPLPVVLALTALIDGLLEAVAARYGIFPIRGPLWLFLWRRLNRIKLLFGNLAARVAAGKTPSARPSRPGGARRPRDEHAFRIGRWVNPKFGWLCRVASESIGAAAFGRALRHMLTTDPEMLALLAATPATARILRPLCFMLGVAMPLAPLLSAATACPPPPEPPEPHDAARPMVVAAISCQTLALPPPRPDIPPPVPMATFVPAALFKAA